MMTLFKVVSFVWTGFGFVRIVEASCPNGLPKAITTLPSQLQELYNTDGCIRRHGSKYFSNAGECQTCEIECYHEVAIGPITTFRCAALDLNPFTANQDMDQCVRIQDESVVLSLHPFNSCGMNACCPITPIVPDSCDISRLDVENPGQCKTLLESGYTCDKHFCASCGPLASLCNKECFFGECSFVGDCYTPLDSPDNCDDGNANSGDGCSSEGKVEPKFHCDVYEGPSVDICKSCFEPANWTDAQGFTCQEYSELKACDINSKSVDGVGIGGRKFSTPNVHQYFYAREVEITRYVSLKGKFAVKALNDAHIFIGKPKERGIELIIGGWRNTMSVIRVYPSTHHVAHIYSSELSPHAFRWFWFNIDFTGLMQVGRGETIGENLIMDGGGAGSRYYLDQLWN